MMLREGQNEEKKSLRTQSEGKQGVNFRKYWSRKFFGISIGNVFEK